MRSRILELLRKAGEAYMSGEEIAGKLGVSRTAVWKHVKELREAGYKIKSRSRSGYTLEETPDCLLPGEIKNGLRTRFVGKDIVFFEEVDSTNRVAKQLAQKGAAAGAVVVAEAQGKGRGRLERPYFSPAGKGIWFSVILRPHILPQEAPKCTLLAAVAVAMAMKRFGLKAEIKWPNDILHEGKKLTGILTEMSAELDRVNYIVIGTGVNVNMEEKDFPEELRGKATSLAIMKGEKLPRVAFFQAVLEALDELCTVLEEEGFAPIVARWREYAVTLGQDVHVIGATGRGSFDGRAVDIDEEGALLVETADGVRRVLAGDVSIRPKKA
ncbi:biotin--[acetyl-CoA-carboxylase] ligase [uncultured Selenomonas sp.]|uniref:biotin--[acetyl-CoA-carboxylase] ligase n=1 Tax=uncultured Selenomonas sp. TaxID=159275 RepID=UPI00260F4561|nr:biotin--[acetyl-CoA-carboxylase] ligase [uncultured Selenomonas sp.]